MTDDDLFKSPCMYGLGIGFVSELTYGLQITQAILNYNYGHIIKHVIYFYNLQGSLCDMDVSNSIVH